ncbi:unnamed protein product [Clonostachys rosea]|uniref:Phenylacetaldoxime dehydratase n=1 Tax=Bionectria ochroleuca TaxID=29856 RepID=A0ABY6TSE2_BIOOC|nr:unnamed protein product [Clonostachys rosea]
MSCPARIYPLRKPRNHRLPIRRWQLAFPKGITQAFTAYVGLQKRSTDAHARQAGDQATKKILAWLSDQDGPEAHEKFDLIAGNDSPGATVWACYWLDGTKYKQSLEQISLPGILKEIDSQGRGEIGLWCESFSSSVSRIETNYSGLDYLPGLAKIPSTSTDEHDRSAYWGAARDRIPDSGWDLFPSSADTTLLDSAPMGLGEHLVGTNYQNLVHIRSGQYWENCNLPETTSYEENLEPTLRSGLEYLWDNPQESGCVGFRYLRNTDAEYEATDDQELKKESCGAGFFTNLESLEHWAKSHPSHLAIYRGALAHFKTFGDERKLRTWHEVSILREGEAKFEYINCAPNTGVMQAIRLEIKAIL